MMQRPGKLGPLSVTIYASTLHNSKSSLDETILSTLELTAQISQQLQIM